LDSSLVKLDYYKKVYLLLHIILANRYTWWFWLKNSYQPSLICRLQSGSQVQSHIAVTTLRGDSPPSRNSIHSSSGSSSLGSLERLDELTPSSTSSHLNLTEMVANGLSVSWAFFSMMLMNTSNFFESKGHGNHNSMVAKFALWRLCEFVHSSRLWSGYNSKDDSRSRILIVFTRKLWFCSCFISVFLLKISTGIDSITNKFLRI